MKTSFSVFRTVLLLGSLSLAAFVQSASGATYTWDPVAGNNQVDAGSGTWDTTTSNWTLNAGATNTTFVSGNTPVFAGMSAAAGTYAITVASGVYSTGLTFNSSGYVLQAATSTSLNIGQSGASTFAANSVTLGSGVTARIGDNISITGGTGGSQSTTLTGAGTLEVIGSSTSAPAVFATGFNNNLNVQGGSTLTAGANGSVKVGNTAAGTLVVGAGASGNGTLNVNSGGSVTAFAYLLNNSLTAGTAVVNLNSGGTLSGNVAASALRFGPSTGTATGGSATLNLNSGGVLAIGAINVAVTGTITAPYSLNLNGGTLRATQSTTTFLSASNLLTTSVGTGGAVIDSNGFNVTVASALTSGAANDGGLTKQGTGILTLTGVNTYAGGTTVTTGALTLGSTTANVLPDSTLLSLASGTTLNLNANNGTSETVASLVVNGTYVPAGTYDVGTLNTNYGTANSVTFASSLGETLTVTAVPEPTTFVSGVLALLALGWHLCRRRACASAL